MSEHSHIRDGIHHAVETIAETLKEGTAVGVGKQAHLPGNPENAQDLTSAPVEFATSTDTVAHVARRLTDLDIDSMPVHGTDGQPLGIVTDRDIVTKVVAKGFDPNTTPVGELADRRDVPEADS